ncbi:MAG: hypothetical protein KC620_23655 [Myxococcales bacterium]|nr:hypothetical protein [Myxococcales bacterium]
MDGYRPVHLRRLRRALAVLDEARHRMDMLASVRTVPDARLGASAALELRLRAYAEAPQASVEWPIGPAPLPPLDEPATPVAQNAAPSPEDSADWGTLNAMLAGDEEPPSIEVPPPPIADGQPPSPIDAVADLPQTAPPPEALAAVTPAVTPESAPDAHRFFAALPWSGPGTGRPVALDPPPSGTLDGIAARDFFSRLAWAGSTLGPAADAPEAAEDTEAAARRTMLFAAALHAIQQTRTDRPAPGGGPARQFFARLPWSGQGAPTKEAS